MHDSSLPEFVRNAWSGAAPAALVVALLLAVAPGELPARSTGWMESASTSPWGVRSEFGSAVFNGKVWIMGGLEGDPIRGTSGRRNDVWYSEDGAIWEQATPSANWPARHSFGVAVFNGRLWVMGGFGVGPTGLPGNDVWSSEDGIHWVEETPNAPWAARQNFTTAVFDGKLWVLGGYDTQTMWFHDDAWSSVDGVNWVQETASAPWGYRYGFGTAVLGGRLWVMGGFVADHQGPSAAGGATGAPRNDVWSSEDGVHWEEVTSSAPWSTRLFLGVVAHGGGLSLWGGRSFETGAAVNETDFWFTTDGVEWTRMPDVSYPARSGFGAHVFRGGLMVFGGGTDGGIGAGGLFVAGLKGDVWFRYESPLIDEGEAPPAQVGKPYRFEVVAHGWPAPEIMVSGLPAWLERQGDALVGTPGEADIGTIAVITVTAVNEYGSDIREFEIEVRGQPPVIHGSPERQATPGFPYRYQVQATGIPAPTLHAENLPAWLTFDAETGELTGTPGGAALGETPPITIRAVNGWSPAAEQVFTINVQSGIGGGMNGGGGAGGCASGPAWPGLPAALLGLLALLLVSGRGGAVGALALRAPGKSGAGA